MKANPLHIAGSKREEAATSELFDEELLTSWPAHLQVNCLIHCDIRLCGNLLGLRSDCPQHEEKKGQLWIFFYLLKQLDIPMFDALRVISNWTITELLYPWMCMWRREKTNRSRTVRQSQQSFCPTAKGKIK